MMRLLLTIVVALTFVVAESMLTPPDHKAQWNDEQLVVTPLDFDEPAIANVTAPFLVTFVSATSPSLPLTPDLTDQNPRAFHIRAPPGSFTTLSE